MSVENGSQFINIAGAATTLVPATASATTKRATVLRRIIFNKKVASGVVTIYDNLSAASGTKVAMITNPATLLDIQDYIEFNVALTNGLVVVTSAADDITVVWD